MQIPKETKLTVKDGDIVLFEEELILLNSTISAAQQGVEVKNPNSAEVWTQRLSTLIQEKYGVHLTPTVCFLLAVKVTRELGELQENFSSGL